MTGSREPVVVRISAVLRAVSEAEPGGASTTAIAQAAGLARPTAHRLLTSLWAEGLTDRDEGSGAWHLGPETYLLGVSAAPRFDVTDTARAAVSRLADRTGESAFFSIRRGDETVCLLREDGSFPLRSHVLYEGIRFPLGVASAGQAILAHLPDGDVDDYLSRTRLAGRWGEQYAEPKLRDRIAQTRELGYTVNPGLIVEGSWGLGAAVFDRRGRPRWALSLTGVETRFTAERRSAMGSMLLREAHRLGRELSGEVR